MNYCNNCGVELDTNMTSCPLCGLAAGDEPVIKVMSEFKQHDIKGHVLTEINNLTNEQKRKLFWEISGIILGTGIIVTLLINLIINKNISWAKYNMVASLTVFANISVFTFWRKKPFLIFIATLISLTWMLLMVDLFGFNIGWGARLGVPILISFYVLLLIVLFLIRISNQLGFNILAIMFIAAGIFLICVEVFISLYFKDKIVFSWSIIASVSIIPVAAILLFVHFKLKKGIELKRFFYI